MQPRGSTFFSLEGGVGVDFLVSHVFPQHVLNNTSWVNARLGGPICHKTKVPFYSKNGQILEITTSLH